MSRLKVSALAPALVAGFAMMAATGFAKDRAPKPIEKAAQIGVVNLMNAEVMHYHAAKDSNGSFWKMRAVKWSVDDMLMQALQERATELGLTLKQLAPTEALERARESCFVNAALADGKLPKQCLAPLTEQASSAGVSYLIVMAPGLNDANHAGAARFENVSAMMRGFSFLTRERAGPKDKPTLYNEVEMLFINVSPEGVTLRARQWGGIYTTQWQTFTMPADPHEIAAEQLDELQPLYAAMLSRQAKGLLDQVPVEP